MNKELYFDIVSDKWAGGLYLITTEAGVKHFYYHHSLSDLENNDNKTIVTETNYQEFKDFWEQFTTDNRWFTFHPLYIHPGQRPLIKEALNKVNWKLIADEKWRGMYQRQWNKVLNNPSEYYKPIMS